MREVPDGQKFTPENAAAMGAMGGANKKGSKHLSTLIREIGENIDWDTTTLKNKEQMKALYGNNGWKAIVYVAMTKSMAGDAKAIAWLSKHDYGQNSNITSNGETIKGAIMEFAQKPTDDTSA